MIWEDSCAWLTSVGFVVFRNWLFWVRESLCLGNSNPAIQNKSPCVHCGWFSVWFSSSAHSFMYKQELCFKPSYGWTVCENSISKSLHIRAVSIEAQGGRIVLYPNSPRLRNELLVDVGMWTPICACLWRIEVDLGVFLYLSPYYFLRHSLLLSLKCVDYIRLAGQWEEPLGIWLPLPPPQKH